MSECELLPRVVKYFSMRGGEREKIIVIGHIKGKYGTHTCEYESAEFGTF